MATLLVSRGCLGRFGRPDYNGIETYDEVGVSGRFWTTLLAVTPWWATELERLRPRLTAFVRQRSTFDPSGLEDIVGGLSLELSDRFQDQKKKYPRSWFAVEDPTATDALKFQGLVWQMCRRRLYDRLRAFYARRFSVSDGADLDRIEANEPNPETASIAREFLRLLAERVGALSVDERDLLARATAASEDETPLASRDRVRLTRLRKKLAKQVQYELRGTQKGKG